MNFSLILKKIAFISIILLSVENNFFAKSNNEDCNITLENIIVLKEYSERSYAIGIEIAKIARLNSLFESKVMLKKLCEEFFLEINQTNYQHNKNMPGQETIESIISLYLEANTNNAASLKEKIIQSRIILFGSLLGIVILFWQRKKFQKFLTQKNPISISTPRNRCSQTSDFTRILDQPTPQDTDESVFKNMSNPIDKTSTCRRRLFPETNNPMAIDESFSNEFDKSSNKENEDPNNHNADENHQSPNCSPIEKRHSPLLTPKI